MGPLRDIRLSRFGALVLAAVSLAATIVILAGGRGRTDAQLAAETALKHPLRAVEQVQGAAASTPSASAATSSGAATGGGTGISPPASDSSSSGEGSDSGAGTAATSSGSAAASSAASGNSASDSSSSSSASSTTTVATTTPAATNAGLPKVGHVFLLTLSTTDYRQAFAASSQAPYLRSLARRGTVLTGYHALGRHGLADLLALVSGQPPNRDTAAGCPKYVAFPQSATLSAAGVAKGTGCVYPDAALTVADQVNAAGKTWGAYVADMGESNCPVPSTDERLDSPLAGTQEGYDVAHNPFAFFGSLLDEGACSEYDQDLTGLTKALATKSATPNLTYIGGDACVDADPKLAPASAASTGTNATGTDTTGTTTSGASTAGTTTAGTATSGTTATTTGTETTPGATTTSATTTTAATPTSTVPARLQVPAAYGCPAGETSGIAGENAFLTTWVPKILASAAYKANGVLVIAFTGADGKAAADTGALVISRWTPKHKHIATSYDAYSLLHSIEDMLDLQPLAKAAGAPAFAQLVLR